MDKIRIYVKVFPKSGTNKVTQLGERQYEVRTTAVPEKGRANKEVIAMLAKHFKTAKSNLEVVGGKTVRDKIVDIII